MLQSIGDALELGSSYEEQSTGGKLSTLCTVPFKLIWGFLVFMVFAWTTSRSGRAFVFGIPTMLFIVFSVALVWITTTKGTSKASSMTRANYRLASNPLSPFYNRDAALLYAKKMVYVQPENPRDKYELGLAHASLDDYTRAHNVIDWISSESQSRAADPNAVISDDQARGYSDAHLWLAGYYGNPEKSYLQEELSKPKSREQLELSYKTNSSNVNAVLGMAGLLRKESEDLKAEADQFEEEDNSIEADAKRKLSFEKTREAINYFNEAIDLPLKNERQLYASIAIIEILQDEGRDEEARLSGRRFINKYEKNARDYPNILPFWVSIVKTCILLDDFERGEKFIFQGYQLAQDPQVRQTLAQLAAQIAVEKAKSFEDMDDEQEFLDKLYALATAIKTDVRVPDGYSELLYYVDGFDKSSEQDFWLRDSVLGAGKSLDGTNDLDPRVPGVIHIILGLRDIINDESEKGQKHWEIAGEQFTLSPFAINYFIQVFSEERELNEDKRNELISVAIKMFPQSPHFYATRGRYYLENESYDQAVEDLEFAAARIPDSISILENLISSYEAKGDEDQVDVLKAKIDEINARAEIDAISTGFASAKKEDK